MNKSDIRRIIKEEITSILNENTPKYSPGDTFMYMGTKHTVISDDGFVVKAKLPTGNLTTLNHNQIKLLPNHPPIHEDIYPSRSGENSLIRGIFSKLNSSRMQDKDSALQSLFNQTKTSSETELKSALNQLPYDELIDLHSSLSKYMEYNTKKWNPNDIGNYNLIGDRGLD
jgi:hypothetical protein